MAYKIKFNDDLNLTGPEMHILRDLDKVHFFENAEYVIVERPSRALKNEYENFNNGIAFWMAEKDAFESYENIMEKARYVVIEFENNQDCKAVHICIPINGGKTSFQKFKYTLEDIRKTGYKAYETSYEIIGNFISKMLYEHFFYDFGEKDTMFAGWHDNPESVEA